MSDGFYSGNWFVSNFLRIDREVWCAPNNEDQWVIEISNVEDLNIDPENINVFPQDIASGPCKWSDVSFVDGGCDFYIENPPT